MPHVLPPLPYDYKALEPHIDEQTMRLHHDIHHKAYVDGLNAAEEKLAAARTSGDFGAVQGLQRALAFHGSGHFNHCVFWENMSPKGGGKPAGELAKRIEKDFGGFDPFRKHFSAAAATVEGNGWGILAWHPMAGHLMVLNPEIRVLHRHAPSGGLRTHGARVITYASSRNRLTHRHLPSPTELYLGQRYFSPRHPGEWRLAP